MVSEERVTAQSWQMPEYFASLLEEGEAGILIEILDLFVNSLDEAMHKLECAASAGDATAVLQMLHKLKGSALQIDASQLFHAVANAESLVHADASQAGQRQKWLPSIEAFRETTESQVRIQLDALRKGVGNAVPVDPGTGML